MTPEERQAERRRQESEDLERVMGLPAGRRIVWGLLEDLGLLRAQLSGEALAAGQFEGRRFAGVQLLQRLQGEVPELTARMFTEAMEAFSRMVREDTEAADDGERDGAD